MRTIRFTLGPKQLEQLEKDRKIIYQTKTGRYEIRLADNVTLSTSTIADSELFAEEKSSIV